VAGCGAQFFCLTKFLKKKIQKYNKKKKENQKEKGKKLKLKKNNPIS
jgi:hypothetical protein